MQCVPVSIKWWKTVVAGGATVIIAQTECQKSQGLQWESSLPSNTVILFLNIPSGVYFHTRNCKFPLDIVALSQNGKVLAIWENVAIEKNQIGPMPKGTNKVMEAAAGWSKNKNIKIGDILPFVKLKD